MRITISRPHVQTMTLEPTTLAKILAACAPNDTIESRISVVDLAVMLALVDEPLPVTAIAETLNLPMATTSVVVSGLVERDLVTREPVPGNRRVHLVTLTPRGHVVINRGRGVARAAFEEEP